jgi:hypothetical protein
MKLRRISARIAFVLLGVVAVFAFVSVFIAASWGSFIFALISMTLCVVALLWMAVVESSTGWFR